MCRKSGEGFRTVELRHDLERLHVPVGGGAWTATVVVSSFAAALLVLGD